MKFIFMNIHFADNYFLLNRRGDCSASPDFTSDDRGRQAENRRGNRCSEKGKTQEETGDDILKPIPRLIMTLHSIGEKEQQGEAARRSQEPNPLKPNRTQCAGSGNEPLAQPIVCCWIENQRHSLRRKLPVQVWFLASLFVSVAANNHYFVERLRTNSCSQTSMVEKI